MSAEYWYTMPACSRMRFSRRRLRRGDIFAFEAHGSLLRAEDAQDEAEERALAAAGFAEDDESLAGADREIYPLEDFLLPKGQMDLLQLGDGSVMPGRAARIVSHEKREVCTMLKSVSKKMTVVMAVTTLEVVESPTPAAPPRTERPL